MIPIRPLAGAMLLTLLVTTFALAGEIEIIMPGGDTSFVPPAADSELSGLSIESAPRRTGSSGGSTDSYSPPKVDSQPGLQTMHFGSVTLACTVASSARDLVVVNEGLETLPPGTRIKWQLKNEGTRGFFAIIGELGGGESLVADGVLDGAAQPDDTCVARVI